MFMFGWLFVCLFDSSKQQNDQKRKVSPLA